MVQETLLLNGAIRATVLVGRRSLIGDCSFRLAISGKGDEKVKNIGINIGKRRCIVEAIKIRSFSKKNIPEIRHGKDS